MDYETDSDVNIHVDLNIFQQLCGTIKCATRETPKENIIKILFSNRHTRAFIWIITI
jgi:hypothetical protein